MIQIEQFKDLNLTGGFTVKNVELSGIPMVDALGREAVAQTRIVGREFRLTIRSGLSDEELSISLYHEILEAASVAVDNPPASVIDFNEAGYEQAARQAHERWGNASPDNLNRLLQFYGFQGK